MDEISEIEITTPLPAEGAIDIKYHIEGTVKIFDDIGAPPWVYARVQKKDWYKPDIIEETEHKRGFPMPVTGEFKIDWTPKKPGLYEIIVVATPAPIALPAVGVFPIVGQSEMMKMTISEELVAGLEILSCSFA